MTAFRPRTPNELENLELVVELLTQDARGLIESYGDHAAPEQLLEAVEPLQTFVNLLADLTAHAADSRRKTRSAKTKAKTAKK